MVDDALVVKTRQDQGAIRHEVREIAGDRAPASGAAAVHEPATQHSPAAQDVPQAPQLLGSARGSVHTPSQTRPRQPPHEPLTHDSLGVQRLPHAPQLDGS